MQGWYFLWKQPPTDGWQDEKAQNVMMNDAFSDKAIQEIAMNSLSNPENFSTFEIDPFPQY